MLLKPSWIHAYYWPARPNSALARMAMARSGKTYETGIRNCTWHPSCSPRPSGTKNKGIGPLNELGNLRRLQLVGSQEFPSSAHHCGYILLSTKEERQEHEKAVEERQANVLVGAKAEAAFATKDHRNQSYMILTDFIHQIIRGMTEPAVNPATSCQFYEYFYTDVK